MRPILDSLRLDLRDALRTLRRSPGFTAIAIAILAVGIGANALMFTAIDALFLRVPAIADPSTVVSVYGGTTTAPESVVSYLNYTTVRDSGVLADVAAFSDVAIAYDDGRQTDLVPAEIVSGNYFSLLGVVPPVSRAFLPEEDRAGEPVRVAVVSHAFWQARLGGDPSAVGREIRVNSRPYTVIGVAPESFRGLDPESAPSAWFPLAVQQEIRPPSAALRRRLGSLDLLAARGSGWLSMAGRLRPPTTLDQANAELAAVADGLRQSPENDRAFHLAVGPLGEGRGTLRSEARPLIRLLSAAALLVLLIVCANVAGLLLARDAARQRERAVRASLGATRWGLVRQSLTESVLVGVAGGAAGVVVASWGVPALYALGVPESVDLRLRGVVVALTFGVGVLSGAATGIATILQMARRDPARVLRDENVSVMTGRHASRLRSGLVVMQVGVSLVLLVGAGLFLRTLRNAYAVDPGYDLEGVLLIDVNLDVSGYSDSAGADASRRILDRAAAVPGVRAIAAARAAVLSGVNRTVAISTDGQPVTEANRLLARVNVVSAGYFESLGITRIRGRVFTAVDTPASPRVAVITRSLADRLWPGSDPIGSALITGGGPLEVVGVVADNAYVSVMELAPPPSFYVPLSQNHEALFTLHVRTVAADAMPALAGIRAAVREIDPRIVVTRPRTLEDEFRRSIDNQRLVAAMIGLFGGLALLLTAMGLYGLMAFAVGQRTREIGVRMAFGASSGSIVAMIARQGVKLVAVGASIGVVMAIGLSGVIRSQLFGVTPTDPLAFGAAIAVLLLVAAAGCIIPASRAARVDPLVALRTE
jgi:predicted permease